MSDNGIEMEQPRGEHVPFLADQHDGDLDEVYGADATHSDSSQLSLSRLSKTGSQGLLASSYAAYCAAFTSICGLLFGYDQGVISVILVESQFLAVFPEIADDNAGGGYYKGLLTAMIEIGALIGAFSQGWLADRLSRKYSIALAAAIFILGSVLQTSAQSYNLLVSARFIAGIGVGQLSLLAPLYISEISPPEIRGSLLVLEELSIVTGIVVAFWITYGTRYIASDWAWRLPFLLQILPGIVLFTGIHFLPFSPRWLVTQGRNQEALTTLSRLRQLPKTDKKVRQEWLDIRSEIRLHQELAAERHPGLQKDGQSFKKELVLWLDLFRSGCWRRTQVGIGVMFFQQFVGINAIIYYAPEMLALLGMDYNMQLIMTGVINIAQLIGVISSIWTMDRLGRRTLLLTGSALMFVSHLIIAGLVKSFSYDWQAHAVAGWVCVLLLLGYMLAFGATWGPVPWALPSEIFPSSLRAKGAAISSCSNWLSNSIIGLITPVLMQSTSWGTYAFFAFFCLLSLVWTYQLVPETAGKTLEQMDRVF